MLSFFRKKKKDQPDDSNQMVEKTTSESSPTEPDPKDPQSQQTQQDQQDQQEQPEQEKQQAPQDLSDDLKAQPDEPADLSSPSETKADESSKTSESEADEQGKPSEPQSDESGEPSELEAENLSKSSEPMAEPPKDKPEKQRSGFFSRLKQKFGHSPETQTTASSDSSSSSVEAKTDALSSDSSDSPALDGTDQDIKDETKPEPAISPAPQGEISQDNDAQGEDENEATKKLAPTPIAKQAQEVKETEEAQEVQESGEAQEVQEAQEPAQALEAEEAVNAEETQEAQETQPAEEKLSWFAKLKKKLASTREALAGRLEKFLSSVREIDEDVLEELEEIMITSDLGIKTTQDILYKIRGQVAKKELKDSLALKKAIKNRITEMMDVPARPKLEVKPLVIMMVGVNGVGKTTTIAKLAKLYQNQGKKVLLAAGDTFRAAAVEQLTIWANRLKVDIIAQPTGADPSAVVYDSLIAASARKIDVVIIDTAGRLHTRVNLMEELKKIKRVASKALSGAPHETILVLDANTGQNAARQAEMFHQAVGVDSLIVTKLDGTSKGGVIVSIINELKLPVTYIGLGEKFDDLRPFDPLAFIEAILGSD
ncbi:MAG: signal recognition particle-docking protein FtsY [Deltaproteobacteria bacterium]|jgi:fused signal recognition particle receptor|nr:signal recognition particle-docking protein FtsY [Deltaproteobacteria bacterium]